MKSVEFTLKCDLIRIVSSICLKSERVLIYTEKCKVTFGLKYTYFFLLVL